MAVKPFIADNVTRCNNIHCSKRNNCRKFAQYNLDIAQGFYPKKTINFDEKDCKQFDKFTKK